jgi:hypothetical protein
VAELCAFGAAADGVEDLEFGGGAGAAKTEPVRNVKVGEGGGFELEIT